MAESSASKASARGPAAAAGEPVAEPEATVISARPEAAGRVASMVEIGRALEGRFLGPYRLDRFVGGGGMGAVFRALDTTLDRVVAVKVLSRQQSHAEEMLRRFRNEAQSAARLDHENIGRVHAVGSDDGWHYIVFEFIEGTNLRDVVAREGAFDVARMINVTIQVVDALEHASQRDVVHRDIKPSNIIITPTGRARIVDMGLARLHHVAGDEDLTVSGMTLGTFDYISPEQARDPRSADVRSDLYSLGCTIFFMLAGRPPFADGTMVQKLLQHQQDAPPAIEALRPDVPRRVGAILGRLMAKDPDARYQRPAELVADLVSVADDLGIEIEVPRPVAVSSPEPPKRAVPVHLPWLVPLLGLVAVVGGLWLWGGGLGSTPVAESSRRGRATGQAEGTDVSGTVAASMRAGEDGVEAGTADGGRIWRVVDVPVVDDDCATVGEAVRRASDGDIVEISGVEARDDGPLSIVGKRLTIRGAEGMRPVLRLGEEGGMPQDGGYWTVVSGSLTLRDIVLQPAFTAAGGGRAALVCLRGASGLACERVSFLLGDEKNRGVCVRADRDGMERQEVRLDDTRVTGGEAFLAATGPGSVDVSLSGGRLVTPGRLLVAEGSSAAGQSPVLRLSLDAALVACGEGVACLFDSPLLPLPPRLQAFARDCRFLVPEGRPFLEQSGIGDPEDYRPAIDWVDAASRYEGSGVWRRIDGAAERFEFDFASQPQPYNHAPGTLDWPAAD